ncbi:MAG: STAS domain-containing protein [bacterium]
MELDYRVRTTGPRSEITVLDIEGGIFISNHAKFREMMDNFVYNKTRVLILNCVKLDFIGSSGIGTIMFTYDRMKKQDAEMVLAGVSGEVRQVFDRLGLSQHVPMYDTEQEAVNELLSGA